MGKDSTPAAQVTLSLLLGYSISRSQIEVRSEHIDVPMLAMLAISLKGRGGGGGTADADPSGDCFLSSFLVGLIGSGGVIKSQSLLDVMPS